MNEKKILLATGDIQYAEIINQCLEDWGFPSTAVVDSTGFLFETLNAEKSIVLMDLGLAEYTDVIETAGIVQAQYDRANTVPSIFCRFCSDTIRKKNRTLQLPLLQCRDRARSGK